MVDEGVVRKAAILCMVVFDFIKVVGSKLFECKLGLDGFIAGTVCHHVDVAEARKVVYEDSRCLVLLSCQLAFELGNKSWLC